MLKTLSIAGFIGMATGILAQLATGTLLSWSPLVIGAQIGAALLMFWARRTFGRRSFHAAANPTAGGLVTSGPYRFIRHPIYTAVSGFSVAGVIGNLSWIGVLLGVVVVSGALVRIFCEEAMVTVLYPEYREYAARTWRMVPYVF
jgi:protein-S-isoprenylcysteine O-methyltransferase Ste14